MTTDKLRYQAMSLAMKKRIAICIRIGGLKIAQDVYGAKKALLVWNHYPALAHLHPPIPSLSLFETYWKGYFTPALLAQLQQRSRVYLYPIDK